MSGLDSNPFADPVDVNPFQVSVVSAVETEGDRLKNKKKQRKKTCLVGCWVRPLCFLSYICHEYNVYNTLSVT